MQAALRLAALLILTLSVALPARERDQPQPTFRLAIDQPLDPVEFGDYVRKTQDSLRVLAEETGGIAVVNQNNFDAALKRIDAETSDYYMLGYSSTNADPLKRTRKIEVRLVNKPGVSVWSRTSYSLRPLPPATQK